MKKLVQKLGNLNIFDGKRAKVELPVSDLKVSDSEVSPKVPAGASFETLHLIEPLLKTLKEEKYVSPTAIQLSAIPHLLKGSDLLGIAQTGTGKTAAFALPILQKLEQEKLKASQEGKVASKNHAIKCLVLAPTRELAIQVKESFDTYGRYLKFRTAVILGGVGMNPQVELLRKGVDILVATPGRFLDLHSQGHIQLQHVSIFVLDEADRMLDMGFLKDVRRIIKCLPVKRQNILFSATMPREIQELAGGLLHKPVQTEVAPRSSTAGKIEQYVYFVEPKVKVSLLLEILRESDAKKVIVFTRMKHMANKVAASLCSADITAEAIHGNKSQSARQRALENFKSGVTKVLVASDLAARGIDIEGVSHVFNFDLPNVSETYVHRIGRTGRAGAAGTAVSFCSNEEKPYLKSIEKLIGKRIQLKESILSMQLNSK